MLTDHLPGSASTTGSVTARQLPQRKAGHAVANHFLRDCSMDDIDRIYDRLIPADTGFSIGRMSEFEIAKELRDEGRLTLMRWPTGIEQDLIAASVLSKEDYALWKHWVKTEGRLPAEDD